MDEAQVRTPEKGSLLLQILGGRENADGKAEKSKTGVPAKPCQPDSQRPP